MVCAKESGPYINRSGAADAPSRCIAQTDREKRSPAISINEMVEVAKLPWGEQVGRVFGKGSGPSRISTITSPQTTRAVWPG